MTHLSSRRKSINRISYNSLTALTLPFNLQWKTIRWIPFLDTIVKPEADGNLSITVYKKPTHTDQYLQMDSHHHLSAKLSVIHTLIHRAQTVCSNPELLCKEKVCLRKALTQCKCSKWALDKVEKRLNTPYREVSDGANNQGITGAQPATSEVKTKGHIVIPYAHKVSMKVSRGSVEGIAYRPTSKVVTPSQTYWSPPRTKSPWSAIVGPYIGSNVVTSRDDEYIGEPPGPLVKDSKCT